jgi:hypothetical protein
MEEQRFDDLTRKLATPISRRQAFKALVATALGGFLIRAGSDEALAGGGNSACAHWCHDHFSGSDAGHCTSEAAHGQGLCHSACGPGGSGGTLCGGPSFSTSTCCTSPSGTCCGGVCTTCPTGGTCSGTTCVCPAGKVNCSGTCQQCCSNSDCPNFQECFKGTCGFCSSSNPCPTGYTCENGGCFKSCPNPSFFTPCGTCTANCTCWFNSSGAGGFCVDAGFGIGRCSSDADCPQGTFCSLFSSGGLPPNLCTRPCPCPA